MTSAAFADEITLTTGRVFRGTIVQKGESSTLVLADYGTFTLPTFLIQTFKSEKEKEPTTLSTNTVAGEQRMPDWSIVV